MKNAEPKKHLTRRQLLRNSLLIVPAFISFPSLSVLASPTPTRRLSFTHTHTGEKLSLVYARNGRYLPQALNRINQYLRDFRTDEIHAIDPLLLDMLHDVQTASNNPCGVFQVVSGYRSPSTNTKLRGASQGVAKRSLHMEGRAIDLRLTGTRTSVLRDIAIGLKRGGTGYYKKSDFVHLDTGRVRRW